MTEHVLANARLILAEEMVHGHVRLVNGRIAEIGTGAAPTGAGAEDCGGDYVLPGLIELHTDHVEGHLAPRPKVKWNPLAAVLAHDAQIATAGITTVFDSLRVWPDKKAVGMDGDAPTPSPPWRPPAAPMRSGPTTAFTCAAKWPPIRWWRMPPPSWRKPPSTSFPSWITPRASASSPASSSSAAIT